MEIKELREKRMQILRIRKFRNEDAREVSNLIRKALVEVNSKDYSSEDIQCYVSMFTPKRIAENSKKRDVYVAVEKDIILGTASLANDFILTVFVNPEYHGQGIGTRLMKHVEKLAKTRGHASVDVPSGITAYEFYRKLGYVRTRNQEKASDRIILMSKRL